MYQITATNPEGSIVKQFNTDYNGALNIARRTLLAVHRISEDTADLRAMRWLAAVGEQDCTFEQSESGARVYICVGE